MTTPGTTKPKPAPAKKPPPKKNPNYQSPAQNKVIAGYVKSGAATKSGGQVIFKKAGVMEQAYTAWAAAGAPAMKASIARGVAAGLAPGLAKKLYNAGYTTNKGGTAIQGWAGSTQAGNSMTNKGPTGQKYTGATAVAQRLAQRAAKQAGIYTQGINSAAQYAAQKVDKKGNLIYKNTPSKPPPGPGPQGLKSPPAAKGTAPKGLGTQASPAAPSGPARTPVYAEANTSTTDLGGMRGKAYKGTGSTGAGTTGGGTLVPTNATGPGPATGTNPPPKQLSPQAKKLLALKGNKQKSGTKPGYHINAQGQVVKNAGKQGNAPKNPPPNAQGKKKSGVPFGYHISKSGKVVKNKGK